MFKLLHRGLFYLLILSIPVNLAKTFIASSSYVTGVLVDYLIPSLYVTDVLIIAILLVWILDEFLKLYLYHDFSCKSYLASYKSFANEKVVNLGYLLLMFVLSLVIATDFSFGASVYKLEKYILFLLLAVYTYFNYSNERDFSKISYLFAFSAVFQSFISVVQWVNGRSFFNNYLFFGEQPVTYRTPGLVYKDYLGELKLTPFGTFPHPNVLSGFLAIVLLFILMFTFKKGIKPFMVCAGLYSLLVLLLTKGSVAIFGLLISLGLFVLYIGVRAYVVKYISGMDLLKKIQVTNRLRIFLTALVLFVFMLINGLSIYSAENNGFGSTSHSVYRRVDLLNASIGMVKTHPFEGVGLNKFTVYLNSYGGVRGLIQFVQPVHNIFFLIASEAGLLSLLFFVLLLGFSFYYFSKPRVFLFFTVLFLIIFVSNFDHYFLTLQQGQLLFWLTLGMGASTIKQDAETQKS